MSTEIICRGAFSPRFFSNFPFQPNTPIAQQIYNTEKEKDCQTFYACFLKNFYMILFPFFPFDKGNFPHYNVAYELFQTQIKTPARLRMGGIRILPLLCRGIFRCVHLFNARRRVRERADGKPYPARNRACARRRIFRPALFVPRARILPWRVFKPAASFARNNNPPA